MPSCSTRLFLIKFLLALSLFSLIVFDLTVAPSDAWLNAGIEKRKGKILRAVDQLSYSQEWCPRKEFSTQVTPHMPKLRFL